MKQLPNLSKYYIGKSKYGKHTWNVKYYEWMSKEEIESAIDLFFGKFRFNGENSEGFFEIDTLLNKSVESNFKGRSNGWFVINTDLLEMELSLVDDHIKACMEELPDFLKVERSYIKMDEDETRQEAFKEFLLADPRITKVLELLDEIALGDFTLIVKDIDLNEERL